MVNTRDVHVVSELPTNRAQQSELRPSPSPSNDTPRRAAKPRLLHGAHIHRTVDAAPRSQQKWVNEPNSNGRGRTKEEGLRDGEHACARAAIVSRTHAQGAREQAIRHEGDQWAGESGGEGGHPDLHGHRFPRPEGKTGNEAFFRRRPLRPTLPALPQWLVNVSDDRAIIYFDTQNSTTAISFIANGTKESAAN